jgi:hypothetical protein
VHLLDDAAPLEGDRRDLVVKAVGLEPTTYGSKDSLRDNPSLVNATSSDIAENDLASCLALLARKSADLALLVERWDALPEAVRAGIVAMAKAAGTAR